MFFFFKDKIIIYIKPKLISFTYCQMNAKWDWYRYKRTYCDNKYIKMKLIDGPPCINRVEKYK